MEIELIKKYFKNMSFEKQPVPQAETESEKLARLKKEEEVLYIKQRGEAFNETRPQSVFAKGVEPKHSEGIETELEKARKEIERLENSQ